MQDGTQAQHSWCLFHVHAAAKSLLNKKADGVKVRPIPHGCCLTAGPGGVLGCP